MNIALKSIIKKYLYSTTTRLNNKMKKESKPTVVFVLGGPGVGKGTQCGIIVEKYKFHHLSAGDLLRQERKSGSQNGQLIQSIIKQGGIVPSYITVKLLETAMHKKGFDNGRFLIDGFPRNQQNLQSWLKAMGDKVYTPFLLQFDAPSQILWQRIQKRSKQSGRSDDNKQSFMKRMQTYNNSTMFTVNYFEKQDKIVRLDGNRTIEDVFIDVAKAFDKLVNELN